MSIANYLMGIGLAAGLVAGMGCESHSRLTRTSISEPEAMKLDEDQQIRHKQKLTICKDLSAVVRKEFDHVNCLFLGEREDIVIRGYEESNGAYWAVWGVNLDNACDAYLREVNLHPWALPNIHFKDYVRTENAQGDVISTPNIGHDAAERLTEAVTLYVGNNGERCKDWARMMHKDYGPLGPIDAPR